MNIVDRAFTDMFSSKRSADAGASTTEFDFWDITGNKGGKLTGVNYKKAMKLSAVYNAVDMLSDSIGIVPFGVYQKTDKGRERRAAHPVDWLLNQDPDGESGYLNAFQWRKLIGTSLKLRGNCLFQIVTNYSGTMYVKYIPWDDVLDIRLSDKGVLSYHIKGNKVLLSSEVLHYKGMSLDGIVGISVITYACINLNLGLEIQQFSYVNFLNKGVRTGVIESDNVLKDDGAKPKIKKAWSSAMQEKSPDRIVVLDDGLKFKPIMLTPQEAQIIESSRFSIEDIARWFNIPLHKIKSLAQSSNNNIEQQSEDYVADSIQPIVTMVEQEESKKLFTLKERKNGYCIKGNMNVLLRADTKSRAEWYSKLVNSGILTANEAREKEDYNSLDGGDVLRFPVNTQTQEQIDKDLKDNGNG
jgi:HK97 family phage portal protein